ncbi:MAG: YIP1 family protein [Parachlamydiales bacterium]|nr:YIP1 family protein [Parachlamydiales bacterium]
MPEKLGINPWITIWFSPKKTIRQIVDYKKNYKIWLLSFIYGFVSLISLSQTLSLGSALNVIIIFIISLILAPIWGYIVFSFASFFMYFTGRWIKGSATYHDVRAAISWSNVPMIVNFALWVLLFVIFGPMIFKNFPGEYALSNTQIALLFVILLLQLIVSIWILVLFVNCLAEVQRFSVAKAILNIVVAIIIFVALFFVASIVYNGLLKLFGWR